MSLPKSDPTSYDNNSILMQNLLKISNVHYVIRLNHVALCTNSWHIF